MKCPSCGLTNPESTQVCDCGYNFETAECAENKVITVQNRRAAHIRYIRWTARSLAGIMILIYAFSLLSIILEGGHKPRPFVLEGSPFGTYAQSTQLGILTLGAGWFLSLVGAIFLFWWERTAAGILIVASIVQIFLWGVWLLNHAMPTNSLRGHMIAFILPPFVTAVLLLIRLRIPLPTQALADEKGGTSSFAPK